MGGEKNNQIFYFRDVTVIFKVWQGKAQRRGGQSERNWSVLAYRHSTFLSFRGRQTALVWQGWSSLVCRGTLTATWRGWMDLLGHMLLEKWYIYLLHNFFQSWSKFWVLIILGLFTHGFHVFTFFNQDFFFNVYFSWHLLVLNWCVHCLY